jgi:hypothetical protein
MHTAAAQAIPLIWSQILTFFIALCILRTPICGMNLLWNALKLQYSLLSQAKVLVAA